MPVVQLQITPEASRDKKKALVQEITDSLVRHLNKKPEHIHIVIQEVPEENWGFAGMLTDEYRTQQENIDKN